MTEDDKYTYPGSGGVLVNKLDIHDAARLDEALNDYASIGWNALRREPIPEPPDFNYLAAIHRRLFEKVLPWAGQLRDVDAQATGIGVPYCRPDYIENELFTLFNQLRAEDYLVGLDRWEFADQLAEHWGTLTAIHPFRDGNTRSQSVYITSLALRACHPIDWQIIDVDRLRELRIKAVIGSSKPLAKYLCDRIST